MSELTTVFIGLLSGIVGATVKSSIEDKKIYESNIIKERKEWRDKIRELTEELNKSHLGKDEKIDYQRIKASFQIRLNPYEEDEDKEIMKCLDELIRYKELEKLNEFNKRIAYLLKHDWERAKYESSKNYLFPERVGLFIAFVISVLLQYKYKNIFKDCGILESIRELIGVDLLFYILTTIFTMACLAILYRLMVAIFSLLKEYKKFKILEALEVLINKFLKKPQRRKYPKKQKLLKYIDLSKKEA